MSARRPTLVVLLLVAMTLPASPALATQPRSPITADLDGTAIALVDVGKYHCYDFDVPVIHCFATAAALERTLGRLSGGHGQLALTATDYVVIYEHASYGGASMYLSQDYSALAAIGWNDRISSFRALNGETGSFHWDWFYGGGTSWDFCCNQNVSSLGIWNDNISSVNRT
jgi:hypothetical protein